MNHNTKISFLKSWFKMPLKGLDTFWFNQSKSSRNSPWSLIKTFFKFIKTATFFFSRESQKATLLGRGFWRFVVASSDYKLYSVDSACEKSWERSSTVQKQYNALFEIIRRCNKRDRISYKWEKLQKLYKMNGVALNFARVLNDFTLSHLYKRMFIMTNYL